MSVTCVGNRWIVRSEVAQHVQARPWVRWVEDDDDSDGGKRQSGAPLVDWAKGMIASGPPLPLLALLTQPTARVPRILYMYTFRLILSLSLSLSLSPPHTFIGTTCRERDRGKAHGGTVLSIYACVLSSI